MFTIVVEFIPHIRVPGIARHIGNMTATPIKIFTAIAGLICILKGCTTFRYLSTDITSRARQEEEAPKTFKKHLNLQYKGLLNMKKYLCFTISAGIRVMLVIKSITARVRTNTLKLFPLYSGLFMKMTIINRLPKKPSTMKNPNVIVRGSRALAYLSFKSRSLSVGIAVNDVHGKIPEKLLASSYAIVKSMSIRNT
ncbi:hypothetical protein DPMN_156508 [Dreissena polymorpha]|uniref:Uncharacterized protein n=1 Tax=Dreissena polymorpha TaxID=45954 RepID=A0A9D4JBX3_DREPO|nr:hypothetical protein DPMN_156508 [Dreissena polymorpha]